MAPKKDPKNNFKNKSKADGGWCTDDLYFDEEGCLYVANKALADAIQSSMAAWKNRLKMYRDPQPQMVAAREAGGEREWPKTVLDPKSAGPKAAPEPPIPGGSGGAAEASMVATKLDAPVPPGGGNADAGTPANMMCPCSPEP
ncbi:MAG TPA: hypothetical protein VE326_00690 [Candidatus Binatia bacterium]|nr:hypothetical protein [Candidatus Binatia bacterium]